MPVVYGFFIGMSTRDTPPTHNIPLYTSGLWGHRIASLWLGMGNGSSRFTSFFFSFVAVLGWAGWGVVVWVLYTYALCTPDVWYIPGILPYFMLYLCTITHEHTV